MVAAVLLGAATLVATQLPSSGAATVPARHTERWALTQAAIAMTSVIRHPTTPTTPPGTGPGGPASPATGAPSSAMPATALSPVPANTAATPSADPGGADATPTIHTGSAAAPATAAVPPVGQATAWGCTAALAYLEAYAAPGFTFQCPGYAEGHAAMTCIAVELSCPGTAVIAITDLCPQAYMNEASNSWVLTGKSDAPIDPYGACPD